MEGEMRLKLQTTLERTAQLIQDKKGKSMDEEQTKLWLIQPVLQALGWNTADPTHVHPEWKRSTSTKRRADYALFGGHAKPVAIVEAKSLRVSLDESKFVEQAVQYAHNAGVPWAILTNGLQWRLYELTTAHKAAEERCVWKVQVDSAAALEKLYLLRHESLSGGALSKWLEDECESGQLLRRDVELVVQTLRKALSMHDDGILNRLAKLTNLDNARVREIWSRTQCTVTGPTEFELDQWSALPTKDAAKAIESPAPVATVGKPKTSAMDASGLSWLSVAESPPVNKKPLCIRVDGERSETNTWSSVVIAVAEQAWIRAPVRFAEALKSGEFATRNKKRLLGLKPEVMNRPVRVGSGYIETNLSAAAAVSAAGKIARFAFGPNVDVQYAIRKEVGTP